MPDDTSKATTGNEACVPAGDCPGEPSGPRETPAPAAKPREIGGRGGLDPTRYGDWEKDGRCIDF